MLYEFLGDKLYYATLGVMVVLTPSILFLAWVVWRTKEGPDDE